MVECVHEKSGILGCGFCLFVIIFMTSTMSPAEAGASVNPLPQRPRREDGPYAGGQYKEQSLAVNPLTSTKTSRPYVQVLRQLNKR